MKKLHNTLKKNWRSQKLVKLSSIAPKNPVASPQAFFFYKHPFLTYLIETPKKDNLVSKMFFICNRDR